MNGYDVAKGPEVGSWQYGEHVQDRAPIRDSGAFYGVSARQESSL